MATKRRVAERKTAVLTNQAHENLRTIAGLDGREHGTAAADMRAAVDQVLRAFPRFELFLDRVRPANQCAALSSLRACLNGVMACHAALDEKTWRELDEAYSSTWPSQASCAQSSDVHLALERISTALAVSEIATENAAAHEQRHAPTLQARDMLIASLVGVFERCAKRDRVLPKALETFVSEVLISAKLPCPDRLDLKKIVGRSLGRLDDPPAELPQGLRLDES